MSLMTTPLTTGNRATSGKEGSRSSTIDINAKGELRVVTFSADGDYLISGGTEVVQVWRVEDGEEVKRLDVPHVRCLAVSRDGKWIATGAWKEVAVWNATTYETVFTHQEAFLNGVDFSPDSTRLLTGSLNREVSVWNFAVRQRVLGPLRHQDIVVATKYSQDGSQFASATPSSVRVYNSIDGCLLVDVGIKVLPWYNTGLLWSDQLLFVVANSAIKKFDTSSRSEVSGWKVQDGNDSSSIALPHHGQYIAYGANSTVTLWDTSSQSQLDLFQHPQAVRSVTLSPDNHFLVIAGQNGKISINSLAHINDSIPLSRLHPTFQEPDIQIDDATRDAWRQGHFDNADTLLTAAITTSQDPNYHALACRALVRTRLGRWDTALADAEQSIEMQPSVIGYIAKSIALVGNGEKDDGYQACDIAFERFHSLHVSFILLVKAIIVFMAGQHVKAISRVDDLIATVHFNSICYVVQAYMYFLLGNSHMDESNYERAIHYFERARTQMRRHRSRALSVVSLISGWMFDDLNVNVQKHLSEALYAAGRTNEAGKLVLRMISTVDEDVYTNGSTALWVPDFMQRCLSATGERSHDAVPLDAPTPLLRGWIKLQLTRGTWKDALSGALNFAVPKFTIYQSICERLEVLDQITGAAECFHHLIGEAGGEKNFLAEQAEWILGFKQRLSKQLECRGDVVYASQRYDEAISEYSAALSLDPVSPDLVVKRSKAYLAKGSWTDALNDADEAIKLDSSSPWGYERKHAALHGAEDYHNAISAFETMLSKMAHSPNPEIRERQREYINPSKTRAAIHKAVRDAIRDLPRVLINTVTGRLVDKPKQAASFETQPVFKEMISAMTTNIDYTRIEQKVTEYYRYATFSHKWEDNEPLFDKVVHTVVYELEESPTHNKLKRFCKIVREAGYDWAWSDTCCINKADHFVLQEALVSMFKWYEGSSLTIVFLRDVISPSQRGDLTRSVWNSRAWTFQEYHASKVVRFYTEDWTPYLNLDIPNHKDSPEIISEMEEATNVPAHILRSLLPGTEDIRDKLCLAAGRETTLVEDAAYSLLGVFSASMSIVYGEGDKALGRLLALLLTSSGDTSILAWTGRSGPFNSCLPAKIAVFKELAITHIPREVTEAEMDVITSRSNLSSLNFPLAQKLYERLNDLATPMFVGKRMKLPCITFKLGPLQISGSKTERVFRAQATALGVVVIRTNEDLSRYGTLYLVHPWIDFLLHRHPVGRGTDTILEGSSDDHASSISDTASPSTPIKRTRTMQFAARILGRSPTSAQDNGSLLPPASESQVDKRMRTLHFVARLSQPFGALLFTPTRQNVPEYKRVASDSKITVQVQVDASLNALIENARTLDVL